MERPRLRAPITSEEDDNSITWDQLGETINFVRRASVASMDFSAASSMHDSSTVNGANRRASIQSSIHSDEHHQEVMSNDASSEPWQKSHAERAQQSLSELLAEAEPNDGAPARRVKSRRRRKRSEKRGLQTEEFRDSGTSGTSWDDLGAEISMALKESMFLGSSVKSAELSRSLVEEDSKPSSRTRGSSLSIQEEQSQDPSPIQKGGAWNCPACTFLNENPLHLVCAICGTAKEAAPVPPAPTPTLRERVPGMRSPLQQSLNSVHSIDRMRNSLTRSVRSDAENSFGSYHEEELHYPPRRRERASARSGSGYNGRHHHSVTGHVSGGASISSRSRSSRDRRGNGVASSRMSLRASFRPGEPRALRDEYDDDMSYRSDDRIGGRIGVDGFSDDEDCSDLSDEETLTMPDDATIKTMKTIKTLRVPEGEVTIIYTDVQGSTSLWEADPASMKKATDLHDSIIRKCYADHAGYEISTEGDAFNLAFQHPADAIGFALKAQMSLFKAKWPEGILNHPDGCYNEKKAFRGFRVRMGMHHGPTTSTVHETTGRTIYQGEAVDIAKAIEKMSHGGQILTTVETWRAVSGMAEQFLGKPQVMDCGEHLLHDPKKWKGDKKIPSKRIVQLVPNQLAYDFFAARGGQTVKDGETPPRVCGRVFPPLLSHGQLSTSFLNAPFVGNRVAMVFVYTDKMENITESDRKKNHKILAKFIRSHLMRLSPPGYECQEDRGSWMLAFDQIKNGIKFGLDLNESVAKCPDIRGDVDKTTLFRIGIHWGPFLSMGPHTITGHADYFGPIVNRAARVAAQCEPGQVCVGVPMGDDEEPPDPGPSVEVDVLGVKQLKGISIEMAIFSCRKRVKQSKRK